MNAQLVSSNCPCKTSGQQWSKQNKSFNTNLPNIVAWHYKENVNFCLTARKAAFPTEYTSLVNKQEFLYKQVKFIGEGENQDYTQTSS